MRKKALATSILAAIFMLGVLLPGVAGASFCERCVPVNVPEPDGTPVQQWMCWWYDEGFWVCYDAYFSMNDCWDHTRCTNAVDIEDDTWLSEPAASGMAKSPACVPDSSATEAQAQAVTVSITA